MAGWVVKPMSVNDVPIVTLTLYSNAVDDYELRRVADELLHRLQSIPDTGRSYVVAGRKRQVRVVADPARLAGHGLDLAAVAQAIEVSNVNLPAGHFSRQDREYVVEAGPFLKSADEVANLLVGLNQGKPVYLKDVAEVIDGPEEPVALSTIAFGPAEELPPGYERGQFYPAVTMAVAKRTGTNAVTVAQGIIDKLNQLKPEVIPPAIRVKVTRDYGATADEKVNELMRELLIAVLSITVLLTLFLGWREALIVALAVPLTLAITLTGNMMFGYTINRVTLFALILSLGLLVDDPIIDVENIHRHFQLREHPPLEATLVAVDEVRAPTILATFTVIISFIPLYFVTGMMGPYMGPMPLNVPLAMLMSLLIAFTVTPWATYHFLKKDYGKEEKPFVLEETWIYRVYTRIMTPLLENRRLSHFFLLGVVGLLVISVLLPVVGLVPLKMLPFDNKNDFLVVADLPNDSPLEVTQEALKDFGRYLTSVSEVDSVVTFAGEGAPIDFNGLVRHYYLMQGPWVGQIRVNLAEKERRSAASHAVTLWIRPAMEEIAQKYKARLKIAEVPPGPPVLQTLVGEVYGPPGASYASIITGWVVKPMSVNDVPIVTLTLYSNAADDYELRRVADELFHRLQSIPDTGRSYVVAGRKRQVRVVADPARLAGHGLDIGRGDPGHRGQQRQSAGGPFLPPGPGIRGGGRAVSEVRRRSSQPPGGAPPGQARLSQGRGRGHRRAGKAVAVSTIAFGPAEALPPGYERGESYPAVTMAVAKAPAPTR